MTPSLNWRAIVADALPSISGDRFRDDEILDELAQHCADRAIDLEAEGLSDAAIRARVLAELGDLVRQARSLRQAVPPAAPASPRRLAGWTVGLWQDARYGLRLIARAPAFSGVALVTMALAIGGATMAFSVVRTVLLKPLPYPGADRIVYVWEVTPRGEPRNVAAPANYLDWRERATSFTAMAAATSPADVALTGVGEPRRIRLARVTPTIFDVFAPAMALGRRFELAESAPGGPPIAILAHGFWRDQLGAAADALGKTIVVDARVLTVVGVLPPTVDFSLHGADVFVPLRFTDADHTERRSHNYYVTARLRGGTSRAAANAEMKTIVTSLTQQFPKDLTKWGAHVAALRDDDVRQARPLLLVVMGLASLLLVIAGANLASLQLVRASRRRGELAIRAAVGAGLGRMIRQLIVEAVLLCGLGGVLAIGLAALMLPVVIAAAPADIPYLTNATIDGAALWFALTVTAASGVLVGLAPALMLWRTDLQPLLHSARTSSGPRQEWVRHALVAVQVGLALVLIVCASLLAKSMWRLHAVDFGFAADGVASAGVFLPAARYPSNESHLQFFDQALERIRAIPGVTAAASSSSEFGIGAGMTFSFAIEGRVAANANGREDPVPLQAVTPQFFETMRIPLLQGRTFTVGDRSEAAAVVIVNDRLARRLFPDGSAVGRRIAFRQGELPWREIVGVVGDTRDEGLDRDAPPTLYLPYAQRQPTWRWMSWQSLLVRTTGDPAAVIPALRRAVWSLDPDLPLTNARPVVAAYAEQLSQRRFALGMTIACASLALILGAIGIYGLLACAVADRRREIGIRRALGANAVHVVGAIVRSTMAFAAAGAVAGVVVALTLTRFLSSLLFEVEPRDPAMFAAAAAVLCGVAALAAWLPARRATSVNPIETLRES